MNCNTANACSTNIIGNDHRKSQFNFDNNDNILLQCSGLTSGSSNRCNYLNVSITNSINTVIINAFDEIISSIFSLQSVNNLLFNAYNKNSLYYTNVTIANINTTKVTCLTGNSCNNLIIKDESNSNINFNCVDTNACYVSRIISHDNTYLNVDCGFNIANGVTGNCENLFIFPSKLLNHTEIKRGNCSYDYEDNFIAITCLTDHKNCDKVAFEELNIECYDDTKPETVNCEGLLTPYPLINSAIPSIINDSGIYFISSATDSYEFGYANITCDNYVNNNNKSLPCIFQCFGTESCSRSTITSNTNDLIFNGDYVCNSLTFNIYIITLQMY